MFKGELCGGLHSNSIVVLARIKLEIVAKQIRERRVVTLFKDESCGCFDSHQIIILAQIKFVIEDNLSHQ